MWQWIAFAIYTIIVLILAYPMHMAIQMLVDAVDKPKTTTA